MTWVEQNPIAQKLKPNQLEILKESIRTPGQEFTTRQVSAEFGIAINTAKNYLSDLVDKGLLINAKAHSGKTVIYIAPASLKSRLNIL